MPVTHYKEGQYYWVKLTSNTDSVIGIFNNGCFFFTATNDIFNKARNSGAIITSITSFDEFISCGKIRKPHFVDNHPLSQVEIKHGDKSKLLYEKMDSLEIGERFQKQGFIREIWGEYSVLIAKSFDVLKCKISSELLQKGKEFKMKHGYIQRFK